MEGKRHRCVGGSRGRAGWANAWSFRPSASAKIQLRWFPLLVRCDHGGGTSASSSFRHYPGTPAGNTQTQPEGSASLIYSRVPKRQSPESARLSSWHATHRRRTRKGLSRTPTPGTTSPGNRAPASPTVTPPPPHTCRRRERPPGTPASAAHPGHGNTSCPRQHPRLWPLRAPPPPQTTGGPAAAATSRCDSETPAVVAP